VLRVCCWSGLGSRGYEFSSILRTIELRFGAAPLTEADANAYPMRNLLR